MCYPLFQRNLFLHIAPYREGTSIPFRPNPAFTGREDVLMELETALSDPAGDGQVAGVQRTLAQGSAEATQDRGS